MRRGIPLLAAAALLAGCDALAQASDAPAEQAWSFSASAYFYILEDDDDYLQPTFTADYDRLHLEARYQYEDRDTTSLWAGYNFSVGEEVTFESTAMLGGIFGDTSGIAPGYRAALGWSKFELYSEGEYVFDSHDSADNYFYAWNEFSWAPVDWFRVGLVGQRTKVYQTDREIQRGLLVGGSFKRVDFSAYWFNPDDDSSTLALALGVTF